MKIILEQHDMLKVPTNENQPPKLSDIRYKAITVPLLTPRRVERQTHSGKSDKRSPHYDLDTLVIP